MKQYEIKQTSIFDAHLSAEALETHVRDLAALPVRGVSRPPRLHTAGRALSRTFMRIAQYAREGEELLPASAWLLDNYPYLEEALRLSETECMRLPALPSLAGDGPRAYRLVLEAVAHSDARVDGELIALCARSYLSLRGLRIKEIWALPRLAAVALLMALVEVAEHAYSAQSDRRRADEMVREILEGEAIRLNESDMRNAAIIERISARLREEQAPRLDELDAQMMRAGIDRNKMIDGEHRRQAVLQLRIANIIGSLRSIEGLDWAGHFEALSPVEALLRSERSGVYARMDFDSRDVLRHAVENFARSHRVSEEQVARAARALADASSGREGHVGYYLYGGGRETLSRHLGDARISMRLRLMLERHGGGLYITAVLLLTALIAWGIWVWQGAGVALLAILPGISLAMRVIGWLSRRLFRPRTLLKLDFEAGIDEQARTLVVVPTLLTSPEQAKAQAAHLEEMYLANRDEQLRFMTLTDFADHDEPTRAGDANILRAARECVEDLRARYGERFGLMHRPRVWHEGQRRYMGRERKRGALEDLNNYILKRDENSFCLILPPADCEGIPFVLTVDADTVLPPGSIARLAGALAHPLNRPGEDGQGHAVLAPRMESLPDWRMTRFQRAYSGLLGLDAYACASSEVYQDIAGAGIFSGKGIYDVKAFAQRLSGRIADNTVLSHDLIEGLYAKAALCSDVLLFDAQPKNILSWGKRVHRWTRGDWQLLPFLADRSLRALDKWKIIDNMRRSLAPAATVLCMLFGTPLFVVVVALMQLSLPMHLRDLESFAYRFCFLPFEAFNQLDAAGRAIWRTLVTHRNMLDWVTAADAEKSQGDKPLWQQMLVQPFVGLLSLLSASPLLAIVWIGALWLAPWLEGAAHRQSELPDEDRKFLYDLAKRTWRWFADNTHGTDHHIPPDNVQYEPFRGAARRTSPTNIGLAMTADVAACDLGFIESEQMLKRLAQKLATVDRLERWRGHLYNWYATDTLLPLKPLYVSAVDNGNLAVCLWAAAAAAREAGGEDVALHCERIADEMDFSLLYDPARRLFHIGYDVAGGQLTGSHYDLLASEARLLSFAAVAKGDVPARHFAAMGRPLTRSGGKPTLLSWSGTLFEYLMPRLFLKDQPGTLLDVSMQGAVSAQMEAAQERPWGESESGYYAFDLSLNYQYKAFGIPSLSMKGGLPGETVIAPYASMLALLVEPKEACRNLRRMADMGFLTEQGFYEAVDYTQSRVPDGAEYAMVRSCMVHHQGMGLLALEGALGGRTLARFARLPLVRAYSVLLSERAPSRYVPVRVRPGRELSRHAGSGRRASRSAGSGEVHLLCGGGTLCALDAQGVGYIEHEGIRLTRFRSAQKEVWGPQVYLRDAASGLSVRFGQASRFEGGQIVFQASLGGVEAKLQVSVSPEDGSVMQYVTLSNKTQAERRLQVTGYIEPVLTTQAADVAHRSFNDLFLETIQLVQGVMVRRRPRAREEHARLLSYVCGGDGEYEGCETSRMKFVGRRGNMDAPAGLEGGFTAETGETSAPIEPCAAVRRAVSIPPGQSAQVIFAVAYGEDAQEATAAPDTANHAMNLAMMRAQVEFSYLKLTAKKMRLYERAAYKLVFSAPQRGRTERSAAQNHLRQSDLWRFGISGDLPMVVVRVSTVAQCALAKEAIAAHEYWHTKGLRADLVLINDHGNDYMQPVRDRLEELVRAAGHLQGANGARGGVHILVGDQLGAAERDLMYSRSSLMLDGEDGSFEKQISALKDVENAKVNPWQGGGYKAIDLPIPLLYFANRYGGFIENGREYVITRRPPAPWCNVIANEHFGTLVTDSMGGYTWAQNSRENKLTPWCNDPVMEPHGEGVYLRDVHSNIVFTFDGRCRHGQGYSIFESGAQGLEARATVFVDRHQSVKCTLIHLRNPLKVTRCIAVEAYAQWVLGTEREDTLLSIHSGAQEGLCWAKNGYTGSGTAFLWMAEAAAKPGADSSLTREIELRPGEETTLWVLLGWSQDEAQAQEICRGFDPDTSLLEVRAFWDNFLGRIRMKTPDEGLNILLNRWFPYQALSCRYWGRTGFYQAGGAFGFRDQLQDALMLGFYEPSILREQILRCAAHQFEEGDVQHWWHEPRRGVRTRIRDDLLFLPWAVADYIRMTGDRDILNERVPYLHEPPLEEGQEDRYGSPQIGREDTLLAHCVAAIENGSRFGAHGLPLMGGGDWNDAMNRVGIHGRGESVWLGWFLCDVLDKFAPLCDEPTRQSMLSVRAQVLEAIERHGWDGGWYRRAFYDNGEPMGTAGAATCEIDLIAQAWGAMTAAPRERAKQAMDAAVEKLFDRENGILRLLTPSFDGSGEDAGYIAGYVSGVRENGGQYTHGAAWGVLGMCALGEGGMAWQLLRALLPIYKDADRYRVEPYVAAADVYSGEHAGRGGWTWYTGSAAWLWRAAVEGLCGLTITDDKASMEPCLPKGWRVEIDYRGERIATPDQEPTTRRFQPGIK